MYKETNEAAGINQWKNQFVEPNTDEWTYSAGDLAEFFRTTPDRLTGGQLQRMQSNKQQDAEETPPRHARMDLSGITPGKEAVLDEVVRTILQALELFDIRVRRTRRLPSLTPDNKRHHLQQHAHGSVAR